MRQSTAGSADCASIAGTRVRLPDARPARLWLAPCSARPLTAALTRLAELRDERKRRARDRFKLVAGDREDRAAWIVQCDQWRNKQQPGAL